MPIKIAISDKVGFEVKGKYHDEAGKPHSFAFFIVARRLDSDALNNALSDNDALVKEFVKEVACDWKGVADEDGNDIEFSAEALDRLLKTPGIPNLIFNTYLLNVAATDAKQKN